MKLKLLSAHIESNTKRVIAITEEGHYAYRYHMNHPSRLLGRLAVAGEIDTKHWILESNKPH